MVKNIPANVGSPRGVDSIPGSEGSWSRKWQPTPVFLLGNPADRGNWFKAIVHRVARESDTT